VVSYYAPLTSDDESLCLADILEHPISVESALISEETCKRVLDALQEEYEQLPEKHKRVIELFYDSDNKVTQKDIATSVGITQATVSKIVSAFRYRVKLRLEEYE
jgi:DNA-directed RNA polymerase specialized sigma subunit